MGTEEIKTSHDLADLLENAARGLRMLPAMQLGGAHIAVPTDSVGWSEQKDGGRKQVPERLTLLAEQLPELNRSEAETCLSSLTVNAIRQLAPLLDIRIPSKAAKNEYVKLLLTQLFDAPAGQELIRTFHKRYDRTSKSKPFVVSRGVRRVPGGKDRRSDGGRVNPS